MRHQQAESMIGPEQGLTPWTVAVPVRPADFKSLWPAHAELGVETDLGAIPAFGVTSPQTAERCAYADFQLLADFPAHRRLGSGRAAFYRGWYLKGIGRTLLAANWFEHDDTWHGSGHMHASAAIREILVTRYLQARGLGHTIVPCEGLLMRRMPERFRREFRAYADARGLRLPAIDYEIQAITVKPGGFARWSNFLWTSAHVPAQLRWVIEFGLLLESYAGGVRAATRPEACTPETIARTLERAVTRACDNFACYFRAGVHWGSFCNNSTLDGRFLDLEVPTILGEGRFFGVVASEPDAGHEHHAWARVFDGGILDYIQQVRSAVAYLQVRLRELGSRAGRPELREFVQALAEQLASTFDGGHLIHSRASQRQLLLDLFADAQGPDDMESAIAAMIADAYGERIDARVVWASTGLELAAPEPMARMNVYVPAERGFSDSGRVAAERRWLSDTLIEFDQMASVDEVLPELRARLAQLDEVIAPIEA